MRIWRKDSTKPIKDANNAKDEQLTDISLSSTPNNDNKKDKMEEIYSTKDKQVKYKRQTPLEAEEAAKRAKFAKEKLASGKAEISLDSPKTPDKIVELTSDYEEGTIIADDVIEEIPVLSNERTVHLQDIDEIDIDIDPSTALKKYERQVMETKRHDERNKIKTQTENNSPATKSHSSKVVSKIPVYQHENKVNKIHLKAGRFTDVVEREYDEYLKSNDPAISKKLSILGEIGPKQSLLYTINKLYHKNAKNDQNPQTSAKEAKKAQPETSQQKAKSKNEDNKEIKKENKLKKFVRVSQAVVKSNKSEDTNQSNSHTNDYHGRQDAKFVAKEINDNFKKTALHTLVFTMFFVIALVLNIINVSSSGSAFSHNSLGPLLYCGINLLIMIICGFMAKPIIKSGLKPLKSFRGNSDTALACAYVACLVQQIASMAFSESFVDTSMHLYTVIITFAFAVSYIGRATMVSRVRRNFRFLASKNPSYAAKIFNDEETARKMLSGTVATRSVIAYQHPTDFMSDFLKISYAPDPSEEVVGKIAPITIISSVFVSVVYGISSSSFIGGLCALAAMCCISIPICILLAGNLPLMLFCKDSLKHSAMLSGYPSIKQFCDCDAVMLSARQLYPKASITLNKIHHFEEYKAEKALACAYAVLKDVKSPLTHIFKQLTENSVSTTNRVESSLYEDKLGVVGFIDGKRLLIGSRKLLDRYNIMIDPSIDEQQYIEKGKDVTFVAYCGQLISMLITTYTPDKTIKAELKKATAQGLCIVVNSTDCNITAEKIATDFEIFFRCVKVLPVGYAATCREAMSQREQTSRAYLATRGKVASLLHAISGSVVLKNNLTVGIVIQIFGLLLGVLLCATMILYASVSILNIFEMLLYLTFWGGATVIAQLIKRK